MLFTLDENRHANDLLYNSPHYPIFNISPHEDCLKAPICVGHYTYEMYKLLQYFGYSDEIGYEDVLNIRNTFFSCDYALDNCETFGVRETDPNESSLEIHDSKGNHRTFNEFIENAPFSWRYFHMLIANHDEWSFSNHCVRDSFKPCDGEGPIKSLGTLRK